MEDILADLVQRQYESASEEKQQQAAPPVPKRKPKRKAAVDLEQSEPKRTELILVAPASLDQEMVRREIATAPTVCSLPELLKKYPHTAIDSACKHATAKLVSSVPPKPAKAKAATASRPDHVELDECRSTVLRDEMHFDASQRVPGLERLLQLRSRLVTGTVRVEGDVRIPTHKEAIHHLRHRVISLPLYTAKHESQLLMQAGTFTFGKETYQFPPCMFGRQCVAARMRTDYRGRTQSDINGLTEPIVLMRAMSPDQWDAFVKTKIPPPGQSPCVLCHRENLAEYVHYVRLTMTSGSALAHVSSEEPNEVAQLWYNNFDCPGGYYKQHMLVPREREVVVAPIVEQGYWSLKAYKSGIMWRIQQEALLWKPPRAIEPKVGEKLENFSRGASSAL